MPNMTNGTDSEGDAESAAVALFQKWSAKKRASFAQVAKPPLWQPVFDERKLPACSTKEPYDRSPFPNVGANCRLPACGGNKKEGDDKDDDDDDKKNVTWIPYPKRNYNCWSKPKPKNRTNSTANETTEGDNKASLA